MNWKCTPKTFTAGLPLWWKTEGRPIVEGIKEPLQVMFAVIAVLAGLYLGSALCYSMGKLVMSPQWVTSLFLNFTGPDNPLRQFAYVNKLSWLCWNTSGNLPTALSFIGFFVLAPAILATISINRICTIGRAAVASSEKSNDAKDLT